MCDAGVTVEELFPEALEVIDPPAGLTRNEYGKQFLGFLDYLVNSELDIDDLGRLSELRDSLTLQLRLMGRPKRPAKRVMTIGDSTLRDADPASPGSETGGKPPRTYNPEASTFMLPALLAHHKYEPGESTEPGESVDSILNYNPISLPELAKEYKVPKTTGWRWFKKYFGGHDKYKAACRIDRGRRLIEILRKLSDENPSWETGANLDQIEAPVTDDTIADEE